VDIVHGFNAYGCDVDIYDPWADAGEVKHEYGITLTTELAAGKYDSIVLAVAHNEFKVLGAEKIRKLGAKACVIYDIKRVLPRTAVDAAL
jgi:UDP-N-acetyl-D-galactosamine dehydrogenase